VTRRLGQCVTRQGGGAAGVALLAVDDGCRVGDVHIPLPTRLPPPPPLRVGDDEGLEGNGAVVVNEDEDDLLLVGGGPSARLRGPRPPSVSPTLGRGGGVVLDGAVSAAMAVLPSPALLIAVGGDCGGGAMVLGIGLGGEMSVGGGIDVSPACTAVASR
jgi:hypothetical protein